MKFLAASSNYVAGIKENIRLLKSHNKGKNDNNNNNTTRNNKTKKQKVE